MKHALETAEVPIDSIQPHPDNIRQGDVGAISESLLFHGQYRPIVVQKSSGYVLAGNHTWKAAKAILWPHIAVTFVDVDDDEARRILLVDNRSNDLASYDEQGLADFLEELIKTPSELAGTGYEPEDLDDLIASLGPSDGDERYTPEWLFEAMGVEFDVDLAAPPGGIPYIPAKRYFTKEDDALAQDWTGLFAWCNPPYSVAADFGQKWLDETQEGLWLGPISHGTAYRRTMFVRARALWFPDNLKFSYHDESDSVKFPLFLGGFGERGEIAIRNLVQAEPEAGLAFKRAKFRG